MMTEHQTETTDTGASDEQAIDTTEATDSDHIRDRLPEDIRQNLTKRAFSPGTLRKILKDTYYIGPIAIGTGGWRGLHGGQPGTGMRRPDGALYNFPRSWRYAALERALNTGLITRVEGHGFSATERGVAVLREIDVCPDCGEERVPGVYSTYYVGNPNTEGHMESHSLVTYCPDCGTDGYGGANVGASTSPFDRDEESVERAVDAIADIPDARTYGGDRDINADTLHQTPDVDPDATENLLETVVEEQAPPTPREVFDATDEGLYERPVVTIPGDGALYRFKGTEDAIAVSRTDTEGDIHLTRESDGRLKVGMDYHTAVEMNVKDALHHKGEGAEWTGDYWTVDADTLGRVVSKLTLAYSENVHRGWAWGPHSDEDRPEDSQFLTVTVTEDAMAEVDAPMVGVDADGTLI